MPAATTIDPQQVYVAWDSFSHPGGVVQRGEKARGSDPAVQAAPVMFVPTDTPMREWPSPLDAAVAMNEERERAEAAARAEAHREAAEANPILLDPTLFRVTRNIETDRDGRPALVLKGSLVLDTDPLLETHPDDLKPVKR